MGQAIAQTSPVSAGPAARVNEWRELQASSYGMPGWLLFLLQEPGVTDVLINGSHVWIDDGTGLRRHPRSLEGQIDSRMIAVRMAAAAGRRLDDASPIVDATIDGRFRLHAVLPPLSKGGASISLRVVREHAFTMSDMVRSNTVDGRTAQLLRYLVRQSRSVLISGATGTGQTSLRATMLGLVPQDQRIVCIEEVSELSVDHPHIVHLQTRGANVEGEGALTLEELVRAAVRMRPDRLVLGECRGAEVREVLTAMNTGHSGGFATIHANSIADVPARLVALGMLSGISPDTVGVLAASAFQAVVHMVRDSRGHRLVSDIGRLELVGGELYGVSDLVPRSSLLVSTSLATDGRLR